MEIPDDYEQLTKPIPMYGVVVKITVPVAGFEPASTTIGTLPFQRYSFSLTTYGIPI